MPVHINDVETEVNAFDVSALLTEEVLQVLARRVAEEIARGEREKSLAARDTAMTGQRRVEG